MPPQEFIVSGLTYRVSSSHILRGIPTPLMLQYINDMKNTLLAIILAIFVISCGNRSALIENKEDQIEKVILRFDTPVNFSESILLWDANLSEIIFKDISGEKLIYDQNLDEWKVNFRPQSIRFIVDPISRDYIRDSLKLLPSDLNYVDSTIVDDGTTVEWMIICKSGELFEGNYKTATENHAKLVYYLLDLTLKQHPDSLTCIYLLNLRDEKVLIK